MAAQPLSKLEAMRCLIRAMGARANVELCHDTPPLFYHKRSTEIQENLGQIVTILKNLPGAITESNRFKTNELQFHEF